MEQEPHPIDRVVVLAPPADADSVTLMQARGSQRIAALQGHTRRDGIAPLVLGNQRYFELIVQLAQSVPVWVLRRPREGWTVDEVVELITERPPG